MKKVMLALCLAAGVATVNAQQKVATAVPTPAPQAAAAKPVDKNAPMFKFTEETHDFGNLKEGDAAVYEFKFKNTGKEPLIITNASASCGCTVPEWPKDPILPGKTSAVKVSFNTAGKNGPFNKTVYIQSNAKSDKDRYEIYIKGSVTPKPAVAPAPTKG